ncbi:hypothetical protein CVT26_010530 [Gymnopilus dilepis]|uniref:Uncharacterized protein n=1 Tax=Gymnopilus dilepis TaxID=231916 RepID=A0A409X483_9AGAR|nr:hypothetical protein CVT26_010530 [Gymnopilus dilepis]
MQVEMELTGSTSPPSPPPSPRSSTSDRPRSFHDIEGDSEGREGISDIATNGSTSDETSQGTDSDGESEMDDEERRRRRASKAKSRKRCKDSDDEGDEDHSEDDGPGGNGCGVGVNDDDGDDDDDSDRVVKKMKLRGGLSGSTKIICWRPKPNVVLHDSDSEGQSSYGAGPAYPSSSAPRPAVLGSPFAEPSTSATPTGLDRSSSPAPRSSSSRSPTPTPGPSSRAATPPQDSSSRSPTPVRESSSAGPSNAAPPSPADSTASSTDGMFVDYSAREIELIDIILKRLT